MKKPALNVADLEKMIESLSPEEQSKACELLRRLGIDFSKPQKDLTGTGVSGFILEKKFYEAESHKDMYLQVASIVLRNYPDQQDKIFTIKGTKKIYFSKKISDFSHAYELIKGTKIYADTNENATQLNRRCKKILIAFGIAPMSLVVIPEYY